MVMDAQKTILVVEDNLDSRELLVHILKRNGFGVAEATTGIEAVDQARAVLPDLILMDLGLPGITGDEATARLKADPRTKDIPIVVNTAYHSGSPLVTRAMAVGAAEVLYKPINFSGIQEIVGRYFVTRPDNANSLIRQDP